MKPYWASISFLKCYISRNYLVFQNGGCRGAAFRTPKMDPLFWKCNVHYVSSRLKWIWSSTCWIWQWGKLEKEHAYQICYHLPEYWFHSVRLCYVIKCCTNCDKSNHHWISSVHDPYGISFIFSEPNGRIQSTIQDNYHISLVSEFICHTVSQQERFARREDHVFTPCRLFPRIWWYVIYWV